MVYRWLWSSVLYFGQNLSSALCCSQQNQEQMFRWPLSLTNWKSKYLLLEKMISWLHKTFNGKIPFLENASGIFGFFSPLKVCIFGSCSSAEDKYSFFNLGIGLLEFATWVKLPHWSRTVANECVCLKPFWMERFASKASDTPRIKPFSLSSVRWSLLAWCAADILKHLTSSYEEVTPSSYKHSIIFFSLTNNSSETWSIDTFELVMEVKCCLSAQLPMGLFEISVRLIQGSH